VKKNTILKIIGEEHLSLHQYPGYFVWTYDDGETFEQTSTYVDQLSHMSLEHWVDDGETFMEYVRVKEKGECVIL
jgi:hypothetical protein